MCYFFNHFYAFPSPIIFIFGTKGYSQHLLIKKGDVYEDPDSYTLENDTHSKDIKKGLRPPSLAIKHPPETPSL